MAVQHGWSWFRKLLDASGRWYFLAPEHGHLRKCHGVR